MSYEDLIARLENIEAFISGQISLEEARRRLAEIMRRRGFPALEEEDGRELH